MIFLDASLLLAFENENDVFHQQAVQLIQAIDEKTYGDPIMSDYVFNEIIGVTFRKKGKERAIALGNYIQNSVFMFNVHDHLLQEAWKLFASAKSNVNLVDCTTIIVSMLAGAEYLATFDKELGIVAGIAVLPKEFHRKK